MSDMGRSLLLITAALLPFISFVSGQCTLTFTLNPQLSNFTIGGQQVSPATTTLVLVHPEALTGLEGSLQGTLAADTCPSTAAELTQQLEGAIFQTTQELGGLTLYPSSVQVGR